MNRFPLSSPAIVGLLPLHDCQVRPTVSVEQIAQRFKQELTLPGVIVMDGMTMLGIISRRHLADHAHWADAETGPVLRPDGYAIILPPLELPDTCPILAAVQQVMQRSIETVGDPFVIKFRDGSRRLVDIRSLMAAQMQILAQLEQTVQSQQGQVEDATLALQQNQQRVGELEQALQAQVTETATHRDLLHQHRTQLQQQMTTTAASHDRLSQVHAVLSQQEQKSFQSTLTAVQAISYRSACLKTISNAVAREVETIQGAADLIKQISRQARFLGLRATVLASRLGIEAEGFGQVTADFGQLSQQALKTGQQLAETVEHLRGRNAELINLAQTGSKVTKALTEQVSYAETVLVGLEHLLATPHYLARSIATNSLIKHSRQRRSNLHKITLEALALPSLTEPIVDHPTLILNPSN